MSEPVTLEQVQAAHAGYTDLLERAKQLADDHGGSKPIQERDLTRIAKMTEPYRLEHELLRDRYRSQEDANSRQAMHELAVSNNKLATRQTWFAAVVMLAVTVQAAAAIVELLR